MSLSVSEQNFKGGVTKIVVREGRGVLMTLPLSDQMKRLALKMAQEGNEKGESGYLALVHKYTSLRDKLLSDPVPADAPPEAAPVAGNWTLPIQQVVGIGAFVEITPDPSKYASVDERIAPDDPLTMTYDRQSGTLTATTAQSAQPDDPLAALLTAAREAEIALVFRKGEFSKAKAEMAEAESAAYKAWEEFNKALRASLPESSHVRGITMAPDNFFEQLIKTAQQMGGEVS